ncbi:MAG: NAD(+) synthase [Zetaproteobacteria bacterium]|nr:NAD(+) synthase [Zetaproteobacteria bacterium]
MRTWFILMITLLWKHLTVPYSYAANPPSELAVMLYQAKPELGQPIKNAEKLIQTVQKIHTSKPTLLITPELYLSGYNLGDNYQRADEWIDKTSQALQLLKEGTRNSNVAIMLGHIIPNHRGGKPLYNGGSFLYKGEIYTEFGKQLLPTYGIFEDHRFFEPYPQSDQTIDWQGFKIMPLICEDAWGLSKRSPHSHTYLYAHSNLRHPTPPKVDLIVAMASSPFAIHKQSYKEKIHQEISQKLQAPLVYVNDVAGVDDLILAGGSFITSKKGLVLNRLNFFEEDQFTFLLHKNKPLSFPSASSPIPSQQQLIVSAITHGLQNYLKANNRTAAVLGVSGGADSAASLALLSEVLAPEHIYCYLMPHAENSEPKDVTLGKQLCENYNIPLENIRLHDISALCENFMKTYPQSKRGIAYENIQSRMRALILRQETNVIPNSLLISNGNLSELLMGYFTLGGDNEGELNLIGSLYKTEVYDLLNYLAKRDQKIPSEILKRTPTANLRPGQKDTDSLPYYTLLDPLLRDYWENNLTADEVTLKYAHLDPERFQQDPCWTYRLLRHSRQMEYKRKQSGVILSLREHPLDIMRRRFPISLSIDSDIPSAEYVQQLLQAHT